MNITTNNKSLWHNQIFWEIIGYISLALCIFGQISVGYMYIPAQMVYLCANVLSLVRSISIKLPKANIIKDVVFTAITAGLIAIYFVR